MIRVALAAAFALCVALPGHAWAERTWVACDARNDDAPDIKVTYILSFDESAHEIGEIAGDKLVTQKATFSERDVWWSRDAEAGGHFDFHFDRESHTYRHVGTIDGKQIAFSGACRKISPPKYTSVEEHRDIVPVARAPADTTTTMCTYHAPQGNTFKFVFDLDRQVLVEGPNMLDGGTTTEAPLKVSDNEIEWISGDGYRFDLDRTTLVLFVNGIHMFDCVVVHKQL